MIAELIDKIAPRGEHRISPSLLWDQDLKTFDWQAGRVLVVQRVVERGWPADFAAAADMYGGWEGVRKIIKEIPYLSEKDIQFVCLCFDLKPSDLKCYTNRLSRQEHFAC